MNDIIDTHTHFWDPARLRYDWLETVPDLNRPFVWDDYLEATADMGIGRMVFVECNCHASQNLDEIRWAEEVAALDPRLVAAVAYADLTDPSGIDENLDRLAKRQVVRGIRHNIQFNPPGFALQDAFVEGIGKVFDRGLHFELCLTHDQMDECVELVNRLDDGPLMLDHCGKPGIKEGKFDDWARGIERLAEHRNVLCKVSGLLTEADTSTWTADDLLPYVDHVRRVFGPERIVFGGDWPVSTLAGGYAAWFHFIIGWTEGWDAGETAAFYAGNAERFYRLKSSAPAEPNAAGADLR